jgi:hypothetical protein
MSRHQTPESTHPGPEPAIEHAQLRVPQVEALKVEHDRAGACLCTVFTVRHILIEEVLGSPSLDPPFCQLGILSSVCLELALIQYDQLFLLPSTSLLSRLPVAQWTPSKYINPLGHPLQTSCLSFLCDTRWPCASSSLIRA